MNSYIVMKYCSHIGDNARIEVIKNAGHALNIEKPKEFARHLKSFLVENGSGSSSPGSNSSSSLSLGWSWSWSAGSNSGSSSSAGSSSSSHPYSLSSLRQKSFFWTTSWHPIIFQWSLSHATKSSRLIVHWYWSCMYTDIFFSSFL